MDPNKQNIIYIPAAKFDNQQDVEKEKKNLKVHELKTVFYTVDNLNYLFYDKQIEHVYEWRHRQYNCEWCGVSVNNKIINMGPCKFIKAMYFAQFKDRFERKEYVKLVRSKQEYIMKSLDNEKGSSTIKKNYGEFWDKKKKLLHPSWVKKHVISYLVEIDITSKVGDYIVQNLALLSREDNQHNVGITTISNWDDQPASNKSKAGGWAIKIKLLCLDKQPVGYSIFGTPNFNTKRLSIAVFKKSIESK